MAVGQELPWTKMINPELVDMKDGSLSLKQTPGDMHLNQNGDMNAGVLFTMSEMSGMGVVVMLLGELAGSSFIASKSVNIDFLARAKGEIVFTGTMPDEQQKRTLQNAREGNKIEEIVQVEAVDSEGKVVSKSTVTAVVSPKRS